MDSNERTFVEQEAQMKQKLPSERKRKRTPKEHSEPKIKDKQIMSDMPKKSSGKGKRTRICDIYNDVEDQYMCLERAAIFLERLDAELPKFAKCMLPSNVLYSFWLILPKKFCVMNLPEHDTTITLVDESGMEFKTNYLKVRHGLSGGWRGFSNAKKLLQGDILFFHLIEPCKLQVNIVRRYGLEAVEAAVCLMEMHPRAKRIRTSNLEKEGQPKKEKPKHKVVKKEKEEKLKKQRPMNGGVKKGKRTRRIPKKRIERPTPDSFVSQGQDGQKVSNVGLKLMNDQCDNCSDVFSSEVLEGSTSELGCCALNLAYHERIDCESSARRIYTSSTVTT